MARRSRRDTGKVLVAHPGTQHSYQTALGLQEVGLLQQYVTSFYYKTPSIFSKMLHFLPTKYAQSLEREFYRRRNENLNDELIHIFPVRELLFVLSARSKFLKRWSDSIIRWRNERFDARVARIVELERPDAMICYDTCSLRTFRASKKVGSLGILDQSIGHITTGIKILREEADIHPEFADSLPTEVPDWLVQLCTEEVLAADYIFAPSEYVRNSLAATGVQSSRVVILPYGTDVERFHPSTSKKEGSFRILFVGQLSQRKGIKYLLEAFRRLGLPNAELILVGGIIGTGEGLKPYRDIFTHVQNVPHYEVQSYFQNADIFVYPSLHEGSALAIYEALASGLPVVTTPNAGSVVRDGEEGFIVPIRDVDALMEKILVLYENGELRELMSRKARQRAELFTWENYRRNLAKTVRELLEKKDSEDI